MPGAWEMSDKIAVHICIPHVTNVTMAWAMSLRQMQLPSHCISMTRGQPIDLARDSLVQKFIESNAEYLFFLDADVTVPSDVIARLMAHNLDIVSGVYHVRHEPVTPAVWIESKEKLNSYNPVISYTPGMLLDVSAVGMGCCLIHRRVFDKLAEPYFKWTIDARGENGVSEDFYFCKAALNAGFHIYVDTTVQCGHIANANVTSNGLTFGDV